MSLRFLSALVLFVQTPGLLADESSGRRVDRYGDPLPRGAMARLGTVQHRATARVFHITPGGKTLLTLAGGRTVGEWDLKTGRLDSERYLPGAPVSHRSWFSPNGKWVAVPEDKEIVLWNVKTIKPVHRFPISVMRAAFSPDSQRLATTSYKKDKCRIQIQDLTTGKARLLAELPSYANDVVFGPQGKRLFAAVDNHSLRCWDIDSGKQLWQNDHWASNLAITPDGRMLCSDTYMRGLIHLWNAKDGTKIASVGKRRPNASQLVCSSDSRYLAEATWSKGVIVWDLKRKLVFRHFKSAGPRAQFSPDGWSLVTLGGMIQRWDIQSGKLLYPDTRPQGHVGPVSSLAFSPDGRFLASCGEDLTLRYWNLNTGQHRIVHRDGAVERSVRIGNLNYSFSPGLSLAFTPNGNHLISELKSGSLALTSLKTAKVIRRFKMPVSRNRWTTLSVARLTPDGKKVVALGTSNQHFRNSFKLEHREPVVGWHIANGKQFLSTTVPGSTSTGGAISPNGELVITPGAGKLHHVSSGEELALVKKRFQNRPVLWLSSFSRFT